MPVTPFGEQVKAQRLEKGYTQKQLADATGIGWGTIGQWEAGHRGGQPSLPNLKALAIEFEVPLSFYRQFFPDGSPTAVMLDGLDDRRVYAPPVVGPVAAGAGVEVEPVDLARAADLDALNFEAMFGPDARAVRVRGASMVGAGILSGDYVLYKPGRTPDHGQKVVAEVDGGYTLKVYHRPRKTDVPKLMPCNAAFDPIVLTGRNKARVVGVVVGVVRKE